jgi:cytochrome b561
MTVASTPDITFVVDAGRHALNRYSMTAKVFHWITVGLVVVMVSSAVMAKQLSYGPWSDTLFMLHKTTGIVTLSVVLLRLCYRVIQSLSRPEAAQRRQVLHWMLYAVVILVPLLGWAGISAFGSLEILPGITLPAIWPKNSDHADVLFMVHAYLAFGLLALVALHIGVAMQDYMMRADDPRRGS